MCQCQNIQCGENKIYTTMELSLLKKMLSQTQKYKISLFCFSRVHLNLLAIFMFKGGI